MPSRSPTAVLPVEGLAVLVAAADQRFAADLATGGHDRLGCIVRVEVVDDEVELSLLALPDGVHPVEALIGSEVPVDWAAAGIAATGTARHLDDPSVELRVRTVHLVGSDGCWASRWAPFGPAAGSVRSLPPGGSAAGDAGDEGKPAGRIDDACRRALGLGTDPPETGTGPLWVLRWLDDVVEAAVLAERSADRRGRGHRSLTWAEVARLHPAMQALDADDPEHGSSATTRPPPTPAEVAARAWRLTAWRGWTSLRRACAEGSLAPVEVDAATAAWLDDGAFARWALGAHPDIADLYAAVEALCRPSVVTAIQEVLVRSADGDRR